MDCLTTLPFLLLCLFTSSYATNIEVHNNCPFTVWAAATPIGGGRRLDRGQNWTINIPPNSKPGSVWGRTNCNFDGSGRGSCQTGDCGGVLRCTDEAGKPPKTLVEYSLNQFNNLDFYDISLVNGFNIPLSFSPTKPIDKCRAISCTADIVGQCPAALRDPGGCTLWMMPPALSLALEEPLIIGLFSAH
nr:osmotin-like protein TPM-1 [Ipomoea trifida]